MKTLWMILALALGAMLAFMLPAEAQVLGGRVYPHMTSISAGGGLALAGVTGDLQMNGGTGNLAAAATGLLNWSSAASQLTVGGLGVSATGLNITSPTGTAQINAAQTRITSNTASMGTSAVFQMRQNILDQKTGGLQLYNPGAGSNFYVSLDSNGVNFGASFGVNIFLSSTNMGIDRLPTNAKLDVSGIVSGTGIFTGGTISGTMLQLVSLTTGIPACNASRAGQVFMNNTTKCLNYCDGTANRPVTSTAAGCT